MIGMWLVAAVLATGEAVPATSRVEVCAAKVWNDTQIDVVRDQVVSFKAEGRWIDLWIPSGPAGHDKWFMRPYRSMRRLPDADWFAVVGCIEKTKCFPIGAEAERVMPASGRLYLYANDVRFMYWNNRGSVHVDIGASAPLTPPEDCGR